MVLSFLYTRDLPLSPFYLFIYLFIQENSETSDTEELEEILTSKSFETLWPNSFHHTTVLLDILDSADILCEVLPLEVNSCYS